jgi:hypothetical protein
MEPGDRTRRESIRGADADAKPQTERKHPDEWERDLNPDHMAGQNIGARSTEGDHQPRSAYDVKELHRMLADEFTDDELKEIHVIPEEQRLQQGGVYIDLNDPQRREFTATGDMSAGPRNLYVSKSDVPYPFWNRLMGVQDPERTHRRRASGD